MLEGEKTGWEQRKGRRDVKLRKEGVRLHRGGRGRRERKKTRLVTVPGEKRSVVRQDERGENEEEW